MVGNGATDWHYDASPTRPASAWGFNMITSNQFMEYAHHNCTQYFGQSTAGGEVFKEGGDAACHDINKGVNGLVDEYFIYDVYRENADVALEGGE